MSNHLTPLPGAYEPPPPPVITHRVYVTEWIGYNGHRDEENDCRQPVCTCGWKGTGFVLRERPTRHDNNAYASMVQARTHLDPYTRNDSGLMDHWNLLPWGWGEARKDWICAAAEPSSAGYHNQLDQHPGCSIVIPIGTKYLGLGHGKNVIRLCPWCGTLARLPFAEEGRDAAERGRGRVRDAASRMMREAFPDKDPS